ncbi:uncharacterized protein LOC128888809 [Hylaeus anthracinus]|uniref:uncharacterized protein LOC128888809 n=1 Tax=Hylaeus anthracinus TaxID=313031 RepID=UPI0023B9B9B1|nr:uncharacterized protein LOC128888809 [Hylaeus anthracinus]
MDHHGFARIAKDIGIYRVSQKWWSVSVAPLRVIELTIFTNVMEQTVSLLHDRTEITESNINRSEDITMEVDKRCRKVCAILGCRSNKKRMFQFPCPVKDNDRYMQWITACRREDFLRLSPKKVRTKVVCDLHFEDRYRFPTKLTRDAIPTCNLPEPAALVEPQEETVIEITEEEEHRLDIG